MFLLLHALSLQQAVFTTNNNDNKHTQLLGMRKFFQEVRFEEIAFISAFLFYPSVTFILEKFLWESHKTSAKPLLPRCMATAPNDKLATANAVNHAKFATGNTPPSSIAR